jgi:hypothetical protein
VFYLFICLFVEIPWKKRPAFQSQTWHGAWHSHACEL